MRRPAVALRPRLAELALLILAALASLVAAGTVALRAPEGPALQDLLPTGLAIAAALAIHAGLVARRRDEDPILLPTALLLVGVGIALSQRLAPALAARQAAFAVLAMAALGACALAPLPLHALQRYRYSAAALGLGLVAATLAFGRAAEAGGPRLWLGVGEASFQPAEALKLLQVVAMAGYLADRRAVLAGAGTRLGPLRLPSLAYAAPLAVMLGLSLLLLAVQRDLGAALLLYAIALALLYAASGRLGYVAFGAAAFVAGAAAMHRVVGIVQARTAIWLDPWSDPSGLGFQPVQAHLAMAAGGVLGRGLGGGMPGAIPAVHTDFVYAAIVEELGVAGAAAVLLLYGLVVLRGLRAAATATDPFAALLAAGLSLALGLQAAIIVAGNLRLMPLTGITLPLLAHGGTSLVASGASIGLVLRLSASPGGRRG